MVQKPCRLWVKLPINWCRISAINSPSSFSRIPLFVHFAPRLLFAILDFCVFVPIQRSITPKTQPTDGDAKGGDVFHLKITDLVKRRKDSGLKCTSSGDTLLKCRRKMFMDIGFAWVALGCQSALFFGQEPKTSQWKRFSMLHPTGRDQVFLGNDLETTPLCLLNHLTSTSLLIHSGGQVLSTKGFGTKTLHPWYSRATLQGQMQQPHLWPNRKGTV